MLRPASTPPIGHTSQTRRSRGFALLITITLVAFLVLVLVALATLTRVETQVAVNGQSQAQARQNALMALTIAIGQLQRHTGPDQRVTATADLQPFDPGTTSDPTSGQSLATTNVAANTLDQIDAYWRDSRNRRWVGAWRNIQDNPADFNADTPSAYNPAPQLQAWLVSGNEETGADIQPQTQVDNLTLSGLTSPSAVTATFGTSAAPYRLLVGPGTVAIETAADVDRAVVAPQVEIKSNIIPGLTDSQTIGHYAWWVGDEGVKARANLSDPYYSATTTDDENRTRLQSAQRPAIEVMTTNGTDGLARLDPFTQSDLTTFKAHLANAVTPGQLALLAPSAPTFPDELKARYHDYSIYSRGVLSDAKHGGLKSDLTYLFARRNLADFRTALNAAYGDNAVAPDTSHNRVFKPETTPYAAFPSSDGSSYATSWPYEDGGTRAGIFAFGCTWEQLWSFANMGNPSSATPAGVFNSAGQAIPRRQTENQQGLYPLVVQAKRFVRLRIVGGGDDLGIGDGVNRTGEIWVDTIPVVVIANPYAVPLAAADYQFDVDGSQGALVFGISDDTTNLANDFYRVYTSTSEPSYIGDPTFVLRSPGMAPGEAQIYTIDASAAANPSITSVGPNDIVPVNSSTHKQTVVMKNDFDPLTALTYNTKKTIPSTAKDPGSSIPAEKTVPTRVALLSWSPQINTYLYIDWATGEGQRRLVQFVRGQAYSNDVGNTFLLVNPIADGTRQGGGFMLALNQAPIDPSYGSGYTASTSSIPQQAPFLQTNYRAPYVFFAGSDTVTGVNHVLEWARTFAKNGDTGQPGDTPNPWLAANLMRPSGSLTTTRWGPVNIGDGQEQTEVPAYISDSNLGLRNLFYDIPRPGHPLASLGQLQHFNTIGFIDLSNALGGTNRQAYVLNSWQNNYTIANSYPHPRVTRDQVFYRRGEMGRHYDGSYLWNDLLWDRFYFSTYPQTGDFDFGSSSDRLINARLRPFRDPRNIAWDDTTAFRGDGDPANATNPRAASSNLLLEGAFNINSTSVAAWKSVFASLKNVPISGKTGNVAPFSRTLAPLGDSTGADLGNTANSWNGYYDFSESDLQALAEEMVMQVRRRGPFTSLSEFVNRRLAAGRTSNSATATDTLRLGLSGPLQAALDAVINQRSDLAAPFNVQAKQFVSLNSGNGLHNVMADADYRMSSGLAGMPGYLLQGDMLSALGTSLAARSDTFVIRTYGDVQNPASGEVTSRAWCEAVVQRLPDYVDDSLPATSTPATGSENDRFGRKYQVVSFRWLTPDDI